MDDDDDRPGCGCAIMLVGVCGLVVWIITLALIARACSS